MRIALSIMAVFMAGICCSAQPMATSAPVKDITPQELSALLGRVFVVDVNEPDNFAEAHVPGAKLVAYDALKAEDLPVDKSKTVVFYCWSPECPAGEKAAQSAIAFGYTDVRCMKAGITGWQDAGLHTEP